MTPDDRERFKRQYGYEPCFRASGFGSCAACICNKKKDHDGPCKCGRCGEEWRFGAHQSQEVKGPKE